MSTAQTLKIESTSSEHTEKIGQILSKVIKPGDTVQLVSDLGGGKTTLAKGIAHGLGYKGDISSPTFTIVKEYKAEHGITIFHYDFYRLNDPGIVKDELAETIKGNLAINIIEWADIVSDILPKEKTIIKLNFSSDDQNTRQIELKTSIDKINKLKEFL